ncbi:MAG: hypothetical protein NTV72_02585, partial [Candidatus Taylorbacteria bacterium]|nr:hypothetical protein [Candidatus Taylorbacteria bacterium]
GIGTATPQYPLDVVGNIRSYNSTYDTFARLDANQYAASIVGRYSTFTSDANFFSHSTNNLYLSGAYLSNSVGSVAGISVRNGYNPYADTSKSFNLVGRYQSVSDRHGINLRYDSTNRSYFLDTFNNGAGNERPLSLGVSSTAVLTIATSTNVGIGTTTPSTTLTVVGTSTLLGHVLPGTDNTYSLGASGNRWASLYSQTLNTGDLVFANDFRLLEASPASTSQAMIWKNQNGKEMFNLDENGNLALAGDICTSDVNCFNKTVNKVAGISEQINSLQNSFQAMTLLSTSSEMMIKISEIIDANLLKIKEWTMEKVTAVLAVFDSIQAKSISTETINAGTATISNGIEMKDTATGLSYCVRITNGQMINTAGSCSNQATSTATNVRTNATINTANVIQSISTPVQATSVVTTSTQIMSTTTLPIIEPVATSTTPTTASSTPEVVPVITPVNTPESVSSTPAPVITPEKTPEPAVIPSEDPVPAVPTTNE